MPRPPEPMIEVGLLGAKIHALADLGRPAARTSTEARLDEIERRVLAIEARWYEHMGENI